MAGTIQLRPPEAFDFRKPDELLKWQKRFEQFRITSGLSAEDETRQVSTLLYCMKEEAEDVLSLMKRKSMVQFWPNSMNISRFAKMSSLRELGSTVERGISGTIHNYSIQAISMAT